LEFKNFILVQFGEAWRINVIIWAFKTVVFVDFRETISSNYHSVSVFSRSSKNLEIPRVTRVVGKDINVANGHGSTVRKVSVHRGGLGKGNKNIVVGPVRLAWNHRERAVESSK